MSLDRLMEYLQGVDEVQIMDLLGLTTEDILDRFKDIILQRRAFIERELEILCEDEECDAGDYFEDE